jgi:hypothetical protein
LRHGKLRVVEDRAAITMLIKPVPEKNAARKKAPGFPGASD